MKKFNSPMFFTGYDVASDLLDSAKKWPVAKDHPVAVGFVEAGLNELTSFDSNDEIIIEPIVNAIVWGLRAATPFPGEMRKILDAVLDEITWAESQSQAN